jgi:hypothetical protein
MTPEAAVDILDAPMRFAETTESQRPKIHVPEAVVDLFQADVLCSAGDADVDPGTVPADATVVTDVASLKMGGVFERRQLERGRDPLK